MDVRLLDHWSPPDGAGSPMACLATSFTFESDFFTEDCLSRFLSLSTTTAEGDHISSLAALLEEEDKLAAAQVSVLIDRSTPAEKRNLRWDLLPVFAPGGLLHAKVAVLIWARAARIVLGSANLTPAGYRRQVEIGLAIDLDENCRIPRYVLDDIVGELRRLVELVPGPIAAAKERAMNTVQMLASRVAGLNLPTRGSPDLILSVAPARPGTSPLDRLPNVWRGPQPVRATLLSPFWDNVSPAPALDAIRKRLTGRPASSHTMTLVVGVDPITGKVCAPSSFADEHKLGARMHAFDSPDPEERRALHAKLLSFESDEWIAAMIGSSNITRAGLGLNPKLGHEELNVWLGCPRKSKIGKQLRALARVGEALEPQPDDYLEQPDEDEATTPTLPVGFISCTLDARNPSNLTMVLVPNGLPNSWTVAMPNELPLLNAEEWITAGKRSTVTLETPDGALPPYLLVQWVESGEPAQATWIVNVQDRGALPPPADLRHLPVEVILAALASTRPIPVALEQELRKHAKLAGEKIEFELDPLRRFDDRGLLLQRARHFSLALWRLQERLSQPVSTIDTLQWRVSGPIGPLAIAQGLIKAAHEESSIPGEAHFRLAELALTLSFVDWDRVIASIDKPAARRLVRQTVQAIAKLIGELGPAPDAALDNYVGQAIAKASR